jgi:hypothetical protein
MSHETAETGHCTGRFGHIAIQEGFITLDQLVDALQAQVQDGFRGEPHRQLGTILCEQGTMTWAQVGQVLVILGRPGDIWEAWKLF